MEPKIVERGAFTVVGLKYRGKNENNEIPQLWQALGPRVYAIKNMVGDHVAYGISANMDRETGEFDYIAGFGVTSAEDVPEGMIAFEIPSAWYAIFSTTLPKIGETFQKAYQTWLPQAGCEPTGGPELEVYDERFNVQDPTSEFDLYVPIKAGQGLTLSPETSTKVTPTEGVQSKNRKGLNTLEAIAGRRSIRRFKGEPIPDEALQAILTAGIQAPSAKNRQPWQFVVISGEKRAEMVSVMREGIAKIKARGEDPGSAEWTADVMEQAPVTVFVFNPEGLRPWLAHSIDQMFQALVNTQSIGAAIQNMTLAALDLGLGSLWICDVLYAYDELCQWLGEEGQMVAALSLGYADESPPARPRKPASEVTRWL
jgi:predicted transcriptional regulator YdeE/nitroreductase